MKADEYKEQQWLIMIASWKSSHFRRHTSETEAGSAADGAGQSGNTAACWPSALCCQRLVGPCLSAWLLLQTSFNTRSCAKDTRPRYNRAAMTLVLLIKTRRLQRPPAFLAYLIKQRAAHSPVLLLRFGAPFQCFSMAGQVGNHAP